jgi:hypothetical protein
VMGASGTTGTGTVVVVVVSAGASVDVEVSTGADVSTVSGAVVSTGTVVSAAVTMASLGAAASSWFVRNTNAPTAASANGTTKSATRATGERRLLTIVRLSEVRGRSWSSL